jgi:PAS domain-containing protein
LIEHNLQLQKLVMKHAPPSESTAALALCENRFASELNMDASGALRAAGSSGSTALNNSQELAGDNFSLLQMLTQQSKNTSFLLTDPKLPDNPIVFASTGFVELTGYARSDVTGRNCRFLQGPGTDPQHVEQIRQGIRTGEDTAVMLTNYKRDGTAFRELRWLLDALIFRVARCT